MRHREASGGIREGIRRHAKACAGMRRRDCLLDELLAVGRSWEITGDRWRSREVAGGYLLGELLAVWRADVARVHRELDLVLPPGDQGRSEEIRASSVEIMMCTASSILSTHFEIAISEGLRKGSGRAQKISEGIGRDRKGSEGTRSNQKPPEGIRRDQKASRGDPTGG